MDVFLCYCNVTAFMLLYSVIYLLIYYAIVHEVQK